MPPLSFYHRLFRILLGVAMFLMASYAVVKSVNLLLGVVLLSFFFSPNHSPALGDFIFTISAATVLAGAILSLVAAIKIIFKRYSHPEDGELTMYAAANTLAVALYWNHLSFSVSDPDNYPLHNIVITAIIGLAYLGSAVAIRRLSRRQDDAKSANSPSHLVK